MSTAAPNRATELVRLQVLAGLDAVQDASLPPRTRRAVNVARTVGAPLIPALDAGLDAERDVRDAERAAAVASAQTRVVAGGLVAAPLILVPTISRLVGADPLAFYTSTIGLVVLGIGVGLLLLGTGIVMALVRRTTRPARPDPKRRLVLAGVGAPLVWLLLGPFPALVVLAGFLVAVRRTSPPPPPAGLDEAAELVATARAGGTTSAEALRIAADELPGLAPQLRRLAFDLETGHGPPPPDSGTDAQNGSGPREGSRPAQRPSERHDELGDLGDVLLVAHESGAPVADALRRYAADLRADELARVLAAAERLPAQLTFPTALCLLPATVLLVGAPIVQAGLLAAGT